MMNIVTAKIKSKLKTIYKRFPPGVYDSGVSDTLQISWSGQKCSVIAKRNDGLTYNMFTAFPEKGKTVSMLDDSTPSLAIGSVMIHEMSFTTDGKDLLMKVMYG
jgi:hypothetical protein